MPAFRVVAWQGPLARAALQQAQAGQGSENFDTLLYERLDATLADYLRVMGEH